jgi:hypothetical protein
MGVNKSIPPINMSQQAHEGLVKNDHKTGTGTELVSSDNRSIILPINYPIFSPVIPALNDLTSLYVTL